MDKKQFCQMLKDARKLAGISWVEVCWRMQRTQASVMQMLNCKEDYGMKKIFNYLEAIDSDIALFSQGETPITLYSFESLSKWIKMTYAGVPQMKMGGLFGIAQKTASNIMRRGDVRMSTFLKMAEDQNLTVHIQPKEVGVLIDSINDCDIE